MQRLRILSSCLKKELKWNTKAHSLLYCARSVMIKKWTLYFHLADTFVLAYTVLLESINARFVVCLYNLSCSFLLATSSCGIWQSIFCFLMLIWNISVCELKIWFRNRQTFSQRHFADFVIFPFMTCITFAKVFFFTQDTCFFSDIFRETPDRKKNLFWAPCVSPYFFGYKLSFIVSELRSPIYT